MTHINLAIVKFCAEEVGRQGRGAIQVWNMVEAWDYAMRQAASKLPPTCAVIQECGHLIEPTKNDDVWRTCGVSVGSHIAPHPQEVPALMERFVAQLGDMTPAEAYREFQEHHPFRDGNGRVGKIIFNWLNDTLKSPQMPPNFFNCINY